MVNLMYCLTNLLFFVIPLLYCHTSLNLSKICCLFLVNFFFSSSISLLTLSFCEHAKYFFGCNSVDAFVILSAILLPIKLPVASAVF